SSEQIEPADSLPESSRNLAGNFSLFRTKTRHVSQLLAVRVSSNDAVDNGRLAGFRMAVLRADSICFDVFRIIHFHKTFVDVAAFRFGNGPGDVEVGNVFRALVTNFSE